MNKKSNNPDQILLEQLLPLFAEYYRHLHGIQINREVAAKRTRSLS